MSVNEGKPFVEYDTNVSINIPPKTTIAYSVIELEVAHTGHYGIDCSACFAKAELYHSVVADWKFCTNYCFCLRNQIVATVPKLFIVENIIGIVILECQTSSNDCTIDHFVRTVSAAKCKRRF